MTWLNFNWGPEAGKNGCTRFGKMKKDTMYPDCAQVAANASP